MGPYSKTLGQNLSVESKPHVKRVHCSAILSKELNAVHTVEDKEVQTFSEPVRSSIKTPSTAITGLGIRSSVFRENRSFFAQN